MSYILTSLLLLMMIRSIMLSDQGRFHQIIWLGFFSRLFLLVVTVTDIIPLPDAHEDAESFHEISTLNQGSPISSWDHLTNYTYFLSCLYYLTDSARWFAQFVNLVFGVYFLVYIRKILCVLEVDSNLGKTILTVAALMPFFNIYSVVLMREAWVTFFITFSLYHFICWYLQQGNGIRQAVLTIIGLVLAMWMHAGAIGIMIGYTMAFLTYYRKENKVRISSSTYIALFLLGIFVLILLLNIEVFAQKLAVDDFGEYAEKTSEGEGGGSDYLTWLDLSSPSKLLLFSPLKMLYFLYSPIVLDWRGLNDIAAFLMDSLFYILISWFALTRKVDNPQYKLLKRYLVISMVITTFLFAFGTSNTGTAIRHRAKLSSIMLALWALSPSKRKTEDQSCYPIGENETLDNCK